MIRFDHLRSTRSAPARTTTTGYALRVFQRIVSAPLVLAVWFACGHPDAGPASQPAHPVSAEPTNWSLRQSPDWNHPIADGELDRAWRARRERCLAMAIRPGAALINIASRARSPSYPHGVYVLSF